MDYFGLQTRSLREGEEEEGEEEQGEEEEERKRSSQGMDA